MHCFPYHSTNPPPPIPPPICPPSITCIFPHLGQPERSGTDGFIQYGVFGEGFSSMSGPTRVTSADPGPLHSVVKIRFDSLAESLTY